MFLFTEIFLEVNSSIVWKISKLVYSKTDSNRLKKPKMNVDSDPYRNLPSWQTHSSSLNLLLVDNSPSTASHSVSRPHSAAVYIPTFPLQPFHSSETAPLRPQWPPTFHSRCPYSCFWTSVLPLTLLTTKDSIVNALKRLWVHVRFSADSSRIWFVTQIINHAGRGQSPSFPVDRSSPTSCVLVPLGFISCNEPDVVELMDRPRDGT